MAEMDTPERIRTGFGLKREIASWLDRDYSSSLVELIKARDYRLEVGNTRVLLAREFGFCYGVDRAIEYAYETVKRFPDRNVYLTGEIIHNPHVNDTLRAMGVGFLAGPHADPRGVDAVAPGDVVILPAFGVTVAVLDRLARAKATLVDTTCGSVLNVWKNVERYAREGMTSLIHGKYAHEETLATCSRVTEVLGGRYLVVRDLAEAEVVASFIRHGGSREDFLAHFARAASPGFDPEQHLGRIGVANQTTMLSTESLAIADLVRRALLDRHGEAEMGQRFRSFDTICSATQDRQDAIEALVREGLDLMLVVGGYNSSNTNHLTEIAARATRGYHIEDATCLVDCARIRHQPFGTRGEIEGAGWLPAGPITVGISAGASTPNSRVGGVIERILELRGVAVADLLAEAQGVAVPPPTA